MRELRMKTDRKKQRWYFLLFLLAMLTVGTTATAWNTTTVQAAKKTGFVQKGGETYYYNKKGKKVKGWKTIKGHKYYFQPKKKGAMAKGFLKIGKKYYFFRKKNGRLATKGWHKIGGRYYYVKKTGVLRTGWFKDSDGKRYFLRKKGKYVGSARTGTCILGKYRRTFNSRGVLIRTGTPNSIQQPDGVRTIRDYLLTAFGIMGTNYIVTAGREMTHEIPSALDCSTYVAWVTYQMGFDTYCWNYARYLPQTYAGFGWGKLRTHDMLEKKNFMGQFKAGDIVCVEHEPGNPDSTGHVWIVVGQCEDGSYVLIHCSGSNNNGCVQIAGTPTPQNTVGEAYYLARDYMMRYHSDVLDRYNLLNQGPYGTQCTDLLNYMTLSSVEGFRWKAKIMSDPDGYKQMTAAQILKDIYGE